MYICVYHIQWYTLVFVQNFLNIHLYIEKVYEKYFSTTRQIMRMMYKYIQVD